MDKSRETNYNKIERTVYIALWAIVGLMPVVVQLYEYLNGVDAAFEMDKVITTWVALLPFFILFWIHDLFLKRLLFLRKVRAKCLYVLLLASMITSMIVIIDMPHKAARREREKVMREVIVTDITTGEEIKRYTRRGNRRTQFNMFLVTNIVFSLFAVSTNIAVNLYFRGLSNRRRIARLEAENTSTRLQFLKYQINPHFFMNTLNNIHSLIDIDAERARGVVVELSKLMRYVLYDIDKDEVTLRQEVNFLNNYIELMRIRLTDNVKISVSLPEQLDNIKLPPLLFIPFVENIFKHGVSYRELSVIDISLKVEDGERIIFRSLNSNHAKTRSDNHHGIGLENLRRRLALLYGSNFELKIEDTKSTYTTMLAIPIKRSVANENKQKELTV